MTLLTIQALGRTNRTFLKRPDIYIFADDRLLERLNTALLEKFSPTPETAALAAACRSIGKEYTPAENKLLNTAERTSSVTMRTIRQLLSKDWTDDSMKLWKAMRETTLRHPTSDSLQKDSNALIRQTYITSGEEINSFIYSQYSEFTNVSIDFSGDVTGFKNSGRTMTDSSGKDRIVLTMSEEDSGLTRLMRYAPLKEHFISQGYAVSFEKNLYVMSPVIYHNIYKGALGEAAGSFILSYERGIELKEIQDPDKFEFFDYTFGNDVYADFKNWKFSYIQDKEKTRKEILDKIDAIGGRRVYIINMTDTHGSKPAISHGGRIVEIPCLIDADGHIDRKMLDMIKED